jgi:hypothetical protein
MSTKKLPDYNHIDEALDAAYHEAHPLSSLRKQTSTETEDRLANGETPKPKRAKMKHFSPILFVKLRVPHGKKGCATKTRMVKALVDSGASESIIKLKAGKNLPLKTKASSQKWQTAAGNLQTTKKTNRTSFSFPELHANKQADREITTRSRARYATPWIVFVHVLDVEGPYNISYRLVNPLNYCIDLRVSSCNWFDIFTDHFGEFCHEFFASF